MITMPNNDLKIFEQLVSMTQKTLLKTTKELLKKYYDNIISTKDYIIAKGDIPIALVAHLDTVHKKPVKDMYYDRKKGVIWSPEGLGADDRAGVFAILKIISTTELRPHIIFTTDEEIGGIGASKLVGNYKKPPFPELKYLIQLDRNGATDCVFYDCENPKFTKYIEKFDFIEDWGSFSDISVIAPAWKTAAVNLSIGYYDEHSPRETLHVAPLFRTIKKVIAMLEDVDNIQKFDYIKSKYAGYYKWYEKAPEYIITNMYNKSKVNCEICGGEFEDYETIPVKGIDGKTFHLCVDCFPILDTINWCRCCGEAFEVDEDNLNEEFCSDCLRDFKGSLID